MAAAQKKRLILLDRDGTINQDFWNGSESKWDGPLNLAQVRLLPEVGPSLAALSRAGARLAICSNQPAHAKGKVSLELLHSIHESILALCKDAGATISSSHLCLHRQEDGCECRKPKPGLLLQAMNAHRDWRPDEIWMVGDRATDIQAAKAAGVRGALLGERDSVSDGMADFEGKALHDFVEFILNE